MKFLVKMTSKNSKFQMLFGGTSVTAGHDNYLNQSYPIILFNEMYSIFKALGIELSVRNIAQGKNECMPYDLCYNAMGGIGDENVDYIGWEQSFNCGRNDNYFELMARIAGYQKAVLFMATSGTQYYGKQCPEDEVINFCSLIMLVMLICYVMYIETS